MNQFAKIYRKPYKQRNISNQKNSQKMLYKETIQRMTP